MPPVDGLREVEGRVTYLSALIAALWTGGVTSTPGMLGSPSRAGCCPRCSDGPFVGRFIPWPDHVMNYIESDAPAELTLVEWRRVRAAASPRRRRSLRSLLPVRPRPAFA